MDDAALVGVVHGPRQGLRSAGAAPHRQRLPASLRREAAAVDEFQREERPPVGLADLVNLHDVRVLQPGDGLGLGPKAVDLIFAGVFGRPGSS